MFLFRRDKSVLPEVYEIILAHSSFCSHFCLNFTLVRHTYVFIFSITVYLRLGLKVSKLVIEIPFGKSHAAPMSSSEPHSSAMTTQAGSGL